MALRPRTTNLRSTSPLHGIGDIVHGYKICVGGRVLGHCFRVLLWWRHLDWDRRSRIDSDDNFACRTLRLPKRIFRVDGGASTRLTSLLGSQAPSAAPCNPSRVRPDTTPRPFHADSPKTRWQPLHTRARAPCARACRQTSKSTLPDMIGSSGELTRMPGPIWLSAP